MKRPTAAVPPKRGRKVIFVIVGVLMVGMFAGYHYWRNSVRTQMARKAVEITPDLRGANGELVARIQTAQKQIAAGRNPLDALTTLLRLYYANGWFEPAAQACVGLNKMEPRNPKWSYTLALIRANGGRLEEALPLLQQTIDRAPDYLPAQLKAAAAMAKLNQVDRAIVLYQNILVKEPTNIYALLGLGNIHLNQKQWDLASQDFQKIISVNNAFRPAWLGMVAVYEATGDATASAEAGSHLAEVSRSPDSPDPWIDSMQEECYNNYYLRVAAFSNPDIDFSRRLLERAVRLQPDDAAAQKDLGMLLYRAKAYPEAKRHLLKATSLAPTDSETWLSLITFLHAAGDNSGVDQAITNGLSHCPSSPGLWLERGRMLGRVRSFDAALAALARSVELGPTEASPHVERAVILFQQEKTDTALQELKTALALQPNHPFALVAMARYAIVTGDRSLARNFFEKVRRNPAVMAEDKSQLTAAFEAAFGTGVR